MVHVKVWWVNWQLLGVCVACLAAVCVDQKWPKKWGLVMWRLQCFGCNRRSPQQVQLFWGGPKEVERWSPEICKHMIFVVILIHKADVSNIDHFRISPSPSSSSSSSSSFFWSLLFLLLLSSSSSWRFWVQTLAAWHSTKACESHESWKTPGWIGQGIIRLQTILDFFWWRLLIWPSLEYRNTCFFLHFEFEHFNLGDF